MLSRSFRSASIVALAFIGSIAGCDCGDQTQAVCRSDADCPDVAEGKRYCDLRTGQCVIETRECAQQFECCGGQVCNQGVFCVDRADQCEADSACTVAGQVCKNFGSGQVTDKGCVFETCGANGACPEGLDCFNGHCVGAAPCNRGCPQNQVCITQTNRCFDVGDGTENDPEAEVQVNRWTASCRVTCAPGNILVLKDPTNLYNRCNRSSNDCECQPLPPIRSRDTARHSSLTAAGDKLLVSAYSGDFGDLVLHTFNKSSLALESTAFLDGVPTGGVIEGDPNGPRGGRSAKGPDVGQHTSIAHDPNGNHVHISYYAVRDGQTVLGDLKYARRSGTSTEWVIHAIDGVGNAGDAGLYTSITVSPDGYPVIAYFVKSGFDSDTSKTAVKVARATTREPRTAADWKVVTVASGTRTPVPCAKPDGTTCADNEVCVESVSSNNGVCRRKSARPSDCRNPSCSSDEACAVNDAGGNQCFTSLRASTLANIPEGNGLFTSVAYVDTKPLVVFYDQNTKTLKGSLADSDSNTAGAVFTNVRTLDDGSPVSGTGTARHDVGQFASLAVGPAGDASLRRIAVAYFDITARQLRLYQAKADFSDPIRFVVDDGAGDPAGDAVTFVGADTSVRFDSGKNVNILYQDSTKGDLKLAVQAGASGGFNKSTVKADGAAGFYANLVVDGANRYVSHAVIKAKNETTSANKLEVLKLP